MPSCGNLWKAEATQKWIGSLTKPTSNLSAETWHQSSTSWTWSIPYHHTTPTTKRWRHIIIAPIALIAPLCWYQPMQHSPLTNGTGSYHRHKTHLTHTHIRKAYVITMHTCVHPLAGKPLSSTIQTPEHLGHHMASRDSPLDQRWTPTIGAPHAGSPALELSAPLIQLSSIHPMDIPYPLPHPWQRSPQKPQGHWVQPSQQWQPTTPYIDHSEHMLDCISFVISSIPPPQNLSLIPSPCENPIWLTSLLYKLLQFIVILN